MKENNVGQEVRERAWGRLVLTRDLTDEAQEDMIVLRRLVEAYDALESRMAACHESHVNTERCLEASRRQGDKDRAEIAALRRECAEMRLRAESSLAAMAEAVRVDNEALRAALYSMRGCENIPDNKGSHTNGIAIVKAALSHRGEGE